MFRSLFIPSGDYGEILGRALPETVSISKLALGIGQPLFGRFSQPSNSFGVVLGHASAIPIANPDRMLRAGKSGRLLQCRFKKPLEGFNVVLRNAETVGITAGDTILRIRTVKVCRSFVPVKRPFRIRIEARLAIIDAGKLKYCFHEFAGRVGFHWEQRAEISLRPGGAYAPAGGQRISSFAGKRELR